MKCKVQTGLSSLPLEDLGFDICSFSPHDLQHFVVIVSSSILLVVVGF